MSYTNLPFASLPPRAQHSCLRPYASATQLPGSCPHRHLFRFLLCFRTVLLKTSAWLHDIPVTGNGAYRGLLLLSIGVALIIWSHTEKVVRSGQLHRLPDDKPQPQILRGPPSLSFVWVSLNKNWVNCLLHTWYRKHNEKNDYKPISLTCLFGVCVWTCPYRHIRRPEVVLRMHF